MKLRACILLASALPLAACQTTDEVSDVDRLAVVLAAVPSNYRQVVPSAFSAVVPDPSGIRTSEISRPFLGTRLAGGDAPMVCVRVQYASGADAQGAGRSVAFIFDDGRLIETQPDNPSCASGTYSLFPELRSAYPGFGAPRA